MIDLYNQDSLHLDIDGVDAIITDPPYAIPTQVATGRTVTRNVGDLSIVEAAFSLHVKKWQSMLSDRGRIFVFCDGASYPVMYRSLYGCFNLASLVWKKTHFGMGREFRKSHEFIIHAWQPTTPVVPSNGVGYSDVIECPVVPKKNRQHPAQKPIELINSLLRVCGETVYDPFMGSGSTGVACADMGKNFIGAEINKDYFETAKKRINGVQPISNLTGDQDV